MGGIIELHHLLLMGAAFVAGFWSRGWRVRRRKTRREHAEV